MNARGAGAEMPDPLALLAANLRDLRLRAGHPSVNELVKLTEAQGGRRAMPRSTIQDKLSGTTAPTLEHVLALVEACATHAASIGLPLPDADIDQKRWVTAWTAMQQARADSQRRRTGATPVKTRGPSSSMATLSQMPDNAVMTSTNQQRSNTTDPDSELDHRAQLRRKLAANTRHLDGTTGIVRRTLLLDRAQLCEELARLARISTPHFTKLASVYRQEADTLNTSASNDPDDREETVS